jgi:hypothetical protein
MLLVCFLNDAQHDLIAVPLGLAGIVISFCL